MFAPITRALRAVFVDNVRLQREGGRLRLQLESRQDQAATTGGETRLTTRAAQEEREQLLLLCIRRELAQMLDAEPNTRQRLPHLAYVEQQLAIQGLALLDKLSVALLRQALKQFEGAVTNWSPVGLATLRSKLAVAVNQRGLGFEEDPNEAEATLPADAANRAPAMEVKEDALGDNEAALLEAYRVMRVGPEAGLPAAASTEPKASAKN